MGHDVMQTIENVRAMQLTIDKMLEHGSMVLKSPMSVNGNGGAVSNKWVLEPLYSGTDCSVGFVHIARVEMGECSTHVHKDSREYLIVTRGSILLNIDGRDVRVVHEGECCAVEAGVRHHSKPLTDDTKLVYICIPEDKDIPSIIAGDK